MYSSDEINACMTEEELFKLWKTKDIYNAEYYEGNKKIEFTINHKNVFIADGIINPEIWNNRSKGKHILFVLKEAYGGENDWSLADEVRVHAPWSAIWHRIVEWTYGLTNTTVERIARYEPGKISFEKPNQWLNEIAVLNIKKSGGDSQSHYGEISAYADYDSKEIIRQIEIINPDIIICGATFGDINRIMGNPCKKGECDNWFYYSDAIGKRERLFIDYYHPANRYPALLNYYGIVNIYQQALISRNNI